MEPSDGLEENSGFVARPPNQLLNYAVEYRWEFTRRHPYYLGLWQSASHHPKLTLDSPEEERRIALVARFGLSLIGVNGDPVPPGTPFEQLSGGDPTFLCGSMQPITIRSIVGLLLGQLSPESKQEIGRYLVFDSDAQLDGSLDEEQRAAKRAAIFGCVMKAEHHDYDRVSDLPLFLMNLDASQETIKEDANRQAKLWKAKKGKGSEKIHTTKLKLYLAIWDRYEGWTGSGYHLESAKVLKEIAAETKSSLSTIHDQYRRAFECIIGRPFTSKRWWSTMGRMKCGLVATGADPTLLKFTRRMMSRNAHRFGNTLPFQVRPEGDSS